MRILNVIEIVDGSILSIDSFVINNDLEEQERVKKAETLFAKKAIENGVSESSVENCIEDGYFAQGDYLLSLTWSDLK